MSRNLRTIRGVIVVIILAIVSSTVVAVLNYKNQQENKEPPAEYVTMPDSVLPDVSFVYEDMTLNSVQGYAQSMDMNLVRGNITPVANDMKIPVIITLQSSDVTAISFQIRSLGDGKLLEDTEVSGWSLNGNEIYVELSLSTLIETDTEYLLDLILATDTHGDIHYYTRIKCGEQKSVLELVQFAKDFSEATINKTESILVSYMLSKTPKTEDSLTYVDLNSRYKLLTWGGINPERTSEYEISMTELGEEQISLNLEYTVKVIDDNTISTYKVNEFYCLRMRSSQVYILNFFRTMKEVKEVNKLVLENKKVNLGMIEEDIQTVNSTKGAYIAFTYDKGLWLYEQETGQLLCLYSDSSIGNESYDIQITAVQEDGTVTFAVYGYVGRGELEGKNLLSWFVYNRGTNSLSRVFEIPLMQTYEFLIGEQLLSTYGTQSGDCYLRLNEGIYCVKNGSQLLDVIASNVLENGFFQNEAGNIIAWQDDKNIAILNMETGAMKKITAESGEFISIQGLNGDNLVYGIGKTTDEGVLSDGTTITPFYALVIMNEEGEEVHRYENSSCYIESTTIETGRIVIERLQKKEEGIYESISYDVLLSTSSSTENAYVKISSSTNKRFRNEIVLQITNATSQTVKATGRLPKLLKQESVEIELKNQTVLSGIYQVYADGGLLLQTHDIAEAIQVAFDKAGVVTGENLSVYWSRSVRKNYVLLSYENRHEDNLAENLLNCMEVMVQTVGGNADLVSKEWTKSGDVGQTLIDVLNKEIINIQGVTVAEMLYYIDEKSPVLIQLGDTSAILLVGYSGNNVMVYDSSGTLRTMTQTELESLMEGANPVTYVCVMR